MITKAIYILAIFSLLSLILSGLIFLLSLSSLRKSGGDGTKRSKAMNRIPITGIILGISSVLSILFGPLAALLFILDIINAPYIITIVTTTIYIFVFIIKIFIEIKRKKTKSEQVEKQV